MNNTAELRKFLIDRMTGLASGKENLAQTQAIAALAKQINTTLALELQAVRVLAGGQIAKPLAITSL